MHSIKINQTTYTIPSTWSEITRPVWKKLSPYVIEGKFFNKEVIAILMTRKKFGRTIPVSKEILDNLQPGIIYEIYDRCLDWLQAENCTHPPFESWKIKGTRYYLPGNQLKYMTLIEYAVLDLCYNVYQALFKANHFDMAQEWRDKLVTYMARPIDKKIDPNDPNTFLGDRREKFNTIICDRRLPIFRDTPLEFKHGVLFYFVGCKKHIHEKYKGVIFQSPYTDEGKEIIGVSKKPPQPEEWIKIAFKLSGGKFGTLKQTQYSNLYDVLEEIKMQQLENIKS